MSEIGQVGKQSQQFASSRRRRHEVQYDAPAGEMPEYIQRKKSNRANTDSAAPNEIAGMAGVSSTAESSSISKVQRMNDNIVGETLTAIQMDSPATPDTPEDQVAGMNEHDIAERVYQLLLKDVRLNRERNSKRYR